MDNVAKNQEVLLRKKKNLKVAERLEISSRESDKVENFSKGIKVIITKVASDSVIKVSVFLSTNL
jgi:hypothetical protein